MNVTKSSWIFHLVKPKKPGLPLGINITLWSLKLQIQEKYLAFRTMNDPSPSPAARWLPSALKPNERTFWSKSVLARRVISDILHNLPNLEIYLNQQISCFFKFGIREREELNQKGVLHLGWTTFSLQLLHTNNHSCGLLIDTNDHYQLWHNYHKSLNYLLSKQYLYLTLLSSLPVANIGFFGCTAKAHSSPSAWP